MLIKKLLIAVLPAIFIILTGCKENSTAAEEIIPNTEAYAYLPLEIGNSWIYDYKSVTEQAVVKIEIKSRVLDEQGEVYRFTQAVVTANPNPNEPIAGYYIKKEGILFYRSSIFDTIATINDPNQTLLKGPIRKGAVWYALNDTFRIAEIKDITVNEEDYKNAVLVVTNSGTDSTWFGTVGIVKRTITYPGTKTEWNLREAILVVVE